MDKTDLTSSAAGPAHAGHSHAGHSHKGHSHNGHSHKGEAMRHALPFGGPLAPGMEKDPVCGMTVDPKTSPHAEHAGKVYHFCCDGCRTTFLAHPEKYARAAVEAASAPAPAKP